MTQQLFIYLANNPEDISWLILDTDGNIIHHPARLPIASLDNPDNTKLHVIIPSDSVLISDVPTPKTNRKQMLQAIPFLLEEQLSEDPREYHFAIEKTDQETTSVAAINNQTMQKVLEQTKEITSLTPTSITPDALLVPQQPNCWTICLTKFQAIVKTGVNQGFTTDVNNLDFLLRLQLDEKQAPTEIDIYNYSTHNAEELAPCISTVKSNTTPENPDALITHLALSFSTTNPINLLQNQYRPQKTKTHTKKIWKIALGLAGAWFIIFILSHGIDYLYLHHKNAKITNQINTIYNKYFPNQTAPSDPQASMSTRLAQLSSSVTGNTFLSNLASTVKAFKANNAIELKQLTFSDNKLTLNISAPEFSQLQAFTNTLKQQGINAKQASAKTSNGKVIATLIITGTGL